MSKQEEVEKAYNDLIDALNDRGIDEDYALNNHNHEEYPEILDSFKNNPDYNEFKDLANEYTDARNRFFYEVTFKKGGGKKRTRRGKSRSRKSRKSRKKKRTKKRRT